MSEDIRLTGHVLRHEMVRQVFSDTRANGRTQDAAVGPGAEEPVTLRYLRQTHCAGGRGRGGWGGGEGRRAGRKELRTAIRRTTLTQWMDRFKDAVSSPLAAWPPWKFASWCRLH